MPRIRVVRTTKGSPDGLTVVEYVEGQTYEMPEDLASVFVREGWGHEVGVEPQERPVIKPKSTKPARPKEAPAAKPQSAVVLGSRRKGKAPR